MSRDEEVTIASCCAATNPSCCASCGVAEIDDIKLKECDGCDLVKYCSDECQQIHKSEHKEECKKRAAELRDELLFKQPESTHLGDCPICSVPLPLDMSKSTIASCCSKLICKGCNLAHQKREYELRLTDNKCPFCRTNLPKTDEEGDKRRMKRIEANDPVAISLEGGFLYKKGDYDTAFEYYTKSSELGDAEAHYSLSIMYQRGLGVEKKKGKEIHHLEIAAIAGHPSARNNLGCDEMENGNAERAVKHWIISAAQGYDTSIKALMIAFKKKYVSKEDLATALRAHKAAIDATKSPQRQAAEEFYRTHIGG